MLHDYSDSNWFYTFNTIKQHNHHDYAISKMREVNSNESQTETINYHHLETKESLLQTGLCEETCSSSKWSSSTIILLYDVMIFVFLNSVLFYCYGLHFNGSNGFKMLFFKKTVWFLNQFNRIKWQDSACAWIKHTFWEAG